MNFALIGMGRSTLAASRFLLRQGYSREQIAFFDEKSENADFRDHASLLKEFRPDVLVVSPGYPLATPWIVETAKTGIKITSEIGLSCESLAEEKIIGITGSVGKSTTVALLGEGAKAFDEHAFIGGNFGFPLCDYVTDVLEGKRPRAKWIVIELSSFQLENCDPLKLDIGAITSFAANHLERYKDLEDYYAIKWSLIHRTNGPVYLNARGGDLARWAALYPGKAVFVDRTDAYLHTYQLENAALLGSHNQDNLAMAAAIAAGAGWPRKSFEAMKAFRGLSHRLENIGLIDGVQFINDSKATALDSVLTAVHSCVELLPKDGRLILLLGGKDKNLPWEQLSDLKKDKRISPIFFGQCANIAKEKSGLDGSTFDGLLKATNFALKNARQGDVVLLSPGGTSLDEFKNFEERGNSFRDWVTRPEPSRR